MSRHAQLPLMSTTGSPSSRSGLRPIAVATHLLLACGLAMSGWVGTAQAQSAAPVPAGTPLAANSRSYSIPPGPLNTVLTRFLAESGVLLTGSTELTQGKQSPGVQGQVPPAAALAALLSGTGLQAVPDAQGRYVLRPAPVSDKQSEATLAPVTVTAEQEATTITEGSGSYTTPAVTIGKTPQSLKEIPQSVSVLTRQRMDDQNMTQVETALDQVTGLQIDTTTGPAGSANVVSRGFLVNNYQADGVPQTFLGSSFTGADLALYDRVEVIRGAAGLLQGAGNPSATVNLVRKKPTPEFAATATASAGSWNFYRGEFDIGGPLNASGTVRARVVAVHEDRDYHVDVMESRKSVLYGVVDIDMGPVTKLTLGGQQQKVDAVPWIFGLPRYSNGSSLELPRSTYLAPAWNRWSQDISEVFFNLEHQLESGWKLNMGFNSTPQDQDFKRSITRGTDTNFGVNPATRAGSIYTGVRWQSEADRRNLDANASGQVTLFDRQHDLTFGLNAQDYDSRTRQSAFFPAVAIPDVFSFDPYAIAEPAEGPFISGTRLQTRQHGVYGSGRFALSDRLKLVLGTRLNWYTTQTDNLNLLTGTTTTGRKVQYERELTPYAGVVYELDKTHSLYASYADIFLPQSAQFTATGDELDPVVGANYETGIKGAYLDGALNASLALFRIDQQNRAQQDPSAPCASAAVASHCYRAEGKVRSQGIEAEVTGKLLPNLDVFAGYTLNTTKYLKDSANQGLAFRPQTPKHLIKLWAQYRMPWDGGRWSLGGGLTAQSSYYALNGSVRSEQGAYAVAGLRIGYQISKSAQVALSVSNLFDKVYYSGIRGVDFGNVYGEPRNVVLMAKASF
jgi:outer membrane receptor for ferric coprogen and ferric-rhodotorulic acid